MNLNIFEFSDYKRYLRKLAGDSGTRRGLKVQMAKALRCQPTYISQVLHKQAHLSLEQAEMLAQFLGHSEEEKRFFLLLVQKDRAGTKALEKFFEKQIGEILAQRLVLAKRLSLKTSLSIDEQATYYSSWHYAALHIAVTVPELQSKEKLAEYFRISPRKVNQVLDFLAATGLCEFTEGKYRVGRSVISLTADSPLISKHHANWRQQAIASLDRDSFNEDLHYSAVISISRKDFAKLKEDFLELLKRQRETIQKSKEEDVFCYCADLFRLEI